MDGETKFVIGLSTVYLMFCLLAVNVNAFELNDLNVTEITESAPLVFDSIVEVLGTSLFSFLIAFIFIATAVWFITVLIKGFGGDISF